MDQGEAGLNGRRDRLDDELRAAQRERRRLGRRLNELDRERVRRLALIDSIESDVERTRTSRSFRYGHGTMRRLSRLLRRRSARNSGLDDATALLEQSRRELGGGATSDPGPSGAKRGETRGGGDSHGGLKIAFIEPHLGAVGGIRRILETSNRLVARGHAVSIYLPPDQPLECKWMECMATLRHLDDQIADDLDFVVFNHEPQWYLLQRFVNARYRVFLALSYSRAYEKNGSWESLRTPVDLRLANSKWTADNIERDIGTRPHVVPTGIDRGLFRPRDVKKRYPVLCIGDKRPWKGTDTIEQACAQLKIELVKLHGRGLEQEDLAAEYCRAEIFVVGSPIDGFGFPGLEALASGTPLVTTDNGGCREYAIDEETALVVPPDDPDAMASAIARLRSNRQLREKLIANGLKIVEERFSWNDAARGLERELSALTQTKPQPATASRAQGLRPPEKHPEVSIIVLSYNTIELLMRCVESIRQHTDVPYELIIVDNASRDGSAEYVKAAADQAILNDKNVGFSAGFNQGLASAHGRLVFFLNSDTKLPPAWASRLRDTTDRCQGAGIVLPAVTAASNPATVRDGTADRVVELSPYIEPPSGVALMLRTATARSLGGWNELYEIASGEDTDLCFAVWVNGLSTILDEAVLVEHVAKASAKQLPDQKRRWALNRERFLERWTGPLNDLPQLDTITDAEFEANKQVARGVAFWMYRYFGTRDPDLLPKAASAVGLAGPAVALDRVPPAPESSAASSDPYSAGSAAPRPIRIAWRLIRPFVPRRLRVRYYRRHRDQYERLFPDRAYPRPHG